SGTRSFGATSRVSTILWPESTRADTRATSESAYVKIPKCVAPSLRASTISKTKLASLAPRSAPPRKTTLAATRRVARAGAAGSRTCAAWRLRSRHAAPAAAARYSRRAMRPLVCLVTALAFVATGCNSEPSVYKAQPTAKCLSGKGYDVTTEDARVGVVAAAAPNGGLLAHEPGNALTI